MSRFTTITFVTALLVVSVTACEKSPTRPSVVAPPPTQPAGATSLQSIRIEGPVSVPPGTTAQFTAIGQISDGTTRDLTSTVTWRSSDAGVLAISASGEATAGRAGEATIAAENNGKRAGLEVLVLTPGRFRLTGLVSDSGIPLAGMTVDLLNGSRASMSTRTDAAGMYRLYDVAGDIEVRVSGQGYPEQVNRLTVTADARSDFAFTSRSDFAGSYRLTITASSRCPSNVPWALPPEAKVRAYDATITQTGPRLNVALSGAPLTAANFTGTVNGGTVMFEIRGVTIDYYFYFDKTFDLVEQFSPASLLVVSGKVTTTQSPSGLSGSLEGVIGLLPSLTGSYVNFSSSCVGQHEFVLTRRS
jgi:Carboxypeptidase regulatory-like domain/Bacterial Ig-like domain (group 2)